MSGAAGLQQVERDLKPLAATIDGLTSLADVMAGQGVTGVSSDYRELFACRDRLLSLDPRTVMAFRHDDLRRLGPDPRLVNVPMDLYLDRAFMGPPDNRLRPDECDQIRRFQSNQFFTSLPPAHAVMKPIFARPFAPKEMPPFQEISRRIIAGLIDELSGAGEIDFVSQFALRATLDFWSELFDLGDEVRDRLVEVIARMAPFVVGPQRQREPLVALNGAIPEYFDILVPAMERVRARGDHLFLNWMAEQFAAITTPPPGLPESPEVALAANMIDGFHALPIGLVNTMYRLLENPQAFEAVRANSELAGVAVEEALRLHSPVPAITRWAIEDFEYDGLHVPAGSLFLLHWSAGNRDPSTYDNPSLFDLGRSHRQLDTFGGGSRICAGRNLVRALSVVGVRALAERTVGLRRTGDITWVERTAVTLELYPTHMPVEIVRT